MQNFFPTLRLIGRSKLLRQNKVKSFIRHRNRTINLDDIGNCVQVRCLSSIAGFDYFSSRNLIHRHQNSFYLFENLQKRWFLGIGDGEEGSALSKVHEERLVLG